MRLPFDLGICEIVWVVTPLTSTKIRFAGMFRGEERSTIVLEMYWGAAHMELCILLVTFELIRVLQSNALNC